MFNKILCEICQYPAKRLKMLIFTVWGPNLTHPCTDRN